MDPARSKRRQDERQKEETMKKLDFTVPFSGFASTTFVNCFASV